MKRLNIRKIFNILKITKKQKFLGRWGKVEGLQLEERIDLANEDHCHCNKYIEEKLKLNNGKKTN